MIKRHEHKLFSVPMSETSRWHSPKDVDSAIDWLLAKVNQINAQLGIIFAQNKVIKELQAELTAIHDYCRSELCSDYCHVDVCSKSKSIKFGDDCEDKPLPCSPEIEIEEIDEPEVSDEYREIIEEQIKLLRETNQELANFSKVDNTDRIRDNAREIANLLWVIAERKSPCANTD